MPKPPPPGGQPMANLAARTNTQLLELAVTEIDLLLLGVDSMARCGGTDGAAVLENETYKSYKRIAVNSYFNIDQIRLELSKRTAGKGRA